VVTNTDRLSYKFLQLAKQCHEHEISLATLVAKFGVDSHALVVLFLSLPFLTPIPLPGLSLVLGTVIALSGLAIALGKPIWLPQFIGTRKISGSILEKIFLAGSRVLQKFEHLIKSRMENYLGGHVGRILSGVLIFLSGIILALPLPPGTNFPPALICVVLALGLLERDRLLTFFGTILFAGKITLALNLVTYISGKF
jgi:hypothetical protein